jgi:uncharacterized protein (TIGR02302 family)
VPALGRVIARTRLAIAAERAVRAFWPVWTLLFLAGALVRLDVLPLLPTPGGPAVLALFALAILAACVLGLRLFRWPKAEEAVRRLDDALPGRPVAALGDRQALGTGDPASRAVWTVHMARVAALAARARSAVPDLRASAFDRYGLRLAAGALFVAALLFGAGSVREQIGQAVMPAPATAMIQGAVIEAWASPPVYTGKPPIYLTGTEAASTFIVPEGTVLSLRLYGAAEPALAETVSGAEVARALDPAGTGVFRSEFPIAATGRVAVTEGTAALAAWSFTVIPDERPEARLTEPPQRTASGAGQFTYEGRDDYGVAAAWARVTLDLARVERRHGLEAEPEAREPIEFDLPLPLTGAAKEFTEKEIVDLTLHPWAGLPVTVTVTGRDEAGQESLPSPHRVILPGRRFFDPVALALVEQRRDLLWSVTNTARVARLLKAVTWQPEGLFTSNKAYLAVRTAIRRLDYALADGRAASVRDEVAELLWRAALLIEDGDLGDALDRLRRAQDRLSKALESDASDQEIAELMDELRQAMQDYLNELMRQALDNQDPQNRDQAEMQPDMSMQDLQEMLDRLEEMMKNGERAEAQELLDQLRQMMENLQLSLRQGQPQNGPGQQMMEGLQDLMRQQQGLGDETFRELQRQFGEGEQPGEPQGPGTGELSQRQEALRRLLEQFREGLPPGLGTDDPANPGDPADDARRALEEAERNMGEARDRLEEGDPGTAIDRQAEALDKLREGMRSLAEQMQQAQNPFGPQSGMEARDQPDRARDPLGRPVGPSGTIDSDDVRIPDAEAARRSRELQDEIRRRAGEQDRPKPEIDYLKRLLDRF